MPYVVENREEGTKMGKIWGRGNCGGELTFRIDASSDYLQCKHLTIAID